MATMEIVANHLKEHALSIGDDAERDLYGRSAFNRYYYATYLHVRFELKQCFLEFPSKHSGVPDYLRGTVRKFMGNASEKARRAEDYDLSGLCKGAKMSALNLASLMEEGYSTRVLADYYPETALIFVGSENFALDQIEVRSAQSWLPRARGLVRDIVNAWRQVNV